MNQTGNKYAHIIINAHPQERDQHVLEKSSYDACVACGIRHDDR